MPQAGEYLLQDDGEEGGRVSYMAQNTTGQFHIGWDGRCWGLWMVPVKSKKVHVVLAQ